MQIPFFRGPWHTVRVLQLVMGLLLFGSYFFYYHDSITLIFSLLLLAQSAFNIGCPLGGGACATPRYRQGAPGAGAEEEEVVYEEIS